MYTVYVNGQPLYAPLSGNEYLLETATLDEQTNTQGSFDFSVPVTNKLWDSLKPRKSRIRIDRNGEAIWRGRIIEIDRGWENMKECHAEGLLALFRDSIIPPFNFKGSPLQLLTFIVSTHNSQMLDAADMFTIGQVTVVDPNGTIVRSSEKAMNAWEALEEKCFGSSLGGYIVLKGMEVSWLADFTDVSYQKVEFGQNLIDLAVETNADDLFTCLIPYGAKISDDPPPEASSSPADWDGNRLTIASVNQGNKMLSNSDAIQKWGKIVATETWDDITIAANLLRTGQTWLNAEIVRAITAIEVTAADLALLDSSLNEIDVGMYVPVESIPHMLKDQLLCTMKSTDIIDPSQTSITLGVGQKPLTSIVGGG